MFFFYVMQHSFVFGKLEMDSKISELIHKLLEIFIELCFETKQFR